MRRKENWDEECEMCKMPDMLHKGPCLRKAEVSAAEYGELWKEWSLFKEKIKLIKK